MPATAPDAPSSPLSNTPSSARASPEVEPEKESSNRKTSKKGGATKAKVPKVVIPPHRPWREIISECIASHPDEARIGVSRQVIKKYAEDVYNLDSTIKGNVSALTRAINAGVDSGIFTLPKGISGKIRLSSDTANAKYKAIIKATKTPTVRTTKAPDPKPIRKRATAKVAAAIAPESEDEDDVEEVEVAEDLASVALTTEEEPAVLPPKSRKKVPEAKTPSKAPRSAKKAAVKKPEPSATKKKTTSTRGAAKKAVTGSKPKATPKETPKVTSKAKSRARSRAPAVAASPAPESELSN